MEKLEIKPRDVLLPLQKDCDALFNADEGWVPIREERRFSIPSARFMGRWMHEIAQHEGFQRNSFRTPPICLSKYASATILPHKFIQTRSGDISGDSCEEIVNANDRAWFAEHSAFAHGSGRVSFPRLASHQWWLGTNFIDVSEARDKPVIEIEGPVVSILAWYQSNISHWLNDIFARLWAAPYFRKPVKFLVPEGNIPFMKETLEIVGISSEDVIIIDNDHNYKIDTLYNISRLASQYNFFTPECTDFYNYIPNNIPMFKEDKDELLYISRRDSKNRPCVNEAEFEEQLLKRGFRVILLTEMDMTARIKALRGAKLVIGACGAGMAHTLLMKDRTHVLVTGTPAMHAHSNMFLNIAAQKSQTVALVGGENLDNASATQDRWSLDLADTLEQVDHFMDEI